MNTSKTARLSAVCIASFVLVELAEVGLAADRERPNVLMIAIDDLNDWVGCLGGHPQVQTPNIDALARRGMNLTNAHCQAPICNPSRISMLLGLLPSTTGHYFLSPGFRDVEVTQDAETIFQYFRKQGYFASASGKIFHGKADPASFDEVKNAGGWRRSKEKLHFDVAGSHPLWDWGQVDVPDEDMRDYRTASWAVERLPQLAQQDQPFFLAVGFALPHVPIYASKKWFDLYPLEQVQMPPSLSTDLADVPNYAVQLSLNPTAPRDAWMSENNEARHAVRAYLAANSFVDHLVGMLLDALESSGEADNTIVVLWSDHGFHLGEKQKWAKRSLWEETTRVPLLFSGPGIVAGQSNQPVGLIDVYPTLADLCSLAIPAHLEGQSLRPVLENASTKLDRPALCTFGKNNHSLRSERYRYTIYADGSQELYDHKNDPHEWKNLAGEAELREVIANHRQWLPEKNAGAVPGSAGSDSPIYGEAAGLQNAKKK